MSQNEDNEQNSTTDPTIAHGLALYLPEHRLSVGLEYGAPEHTQYPHGLAITTCGNRMSYSILLPSNFSKVGLLSVPRNQDYRFKLSDSSEVWLNSNSRIVFPFLFDKLRQVTVNGEAYFNIARQEDKNSPKMFYVKYPDYELSTTESVFVSRSRGAGLLYLSVYQGKVNVKYDGEVNEIPAGYEATFADGSYIKKQIDTVKKSIPHWAHHTFEIPPGTTLKSLKRKLEKIYSINIVFEDSAATKVVAEGAINTQEPISEYLRDLWYDTEIDYYFSKNNDTVYLSKPDIGWRDKGGYDSVGVK
ncbi:FecR family protein [Olivibacter jilunii]|uniref:FecR family protein n=1 Tax=Olivibacter jilunii TaxID=985016 RepID=UPI0013EF35BB|nr:FecR family protein [Olivibacter jilunii]